MDGRVVAALALACVGTVLLSGLAPALHTAGRSTIDPIKMSGAGASAGRKARRWATVLLTAQLAVSVMLLCSVAGSLRAFLNGDRGWPIDGTGLLTMRLELSPDGHTPATGQEEVYRTVRERLQSIPSVSAVGIATAMPGAGPARLKLAIQGRAGSPAAAPLTPTIGVDQGYFETLGIPLLEGRAFTALDGLSAYPVRGDCGDLLDWMAGAPRARERQRPGDIRWRRSCLLRSPGVHCEPSGRFSRARRG